MVASQYTIFVQCDSSVGSRAINNQRQQLIADTQCSEIMRTSVDLADYIVVVTVLYQI